MTPEEALEVCKLARDRIIDDDGYLNTVIQALEKQIPKKPFETYDDDTCIYKHFECPTCGERQSRHASLVYCMSCGQAISWLHENGEEETK